MKNEPNKTVSMLKIGEHSRKAHGNPRWAGCYPIEKEIIN